MGGLAASGGRGVVSLREGPASISWLACWHAPAARGVCPLRRGVVSVGAQQVASNYYISVIRECLSSLRCDCCVNGGTLLLWGWPLRGGEAYDLPTGGRTIAMT